MIDSFEDAPGLPSVSAPDLQKTRRERASVPAGTGDRLLPHSPKMERGALGCQLLDPRCVSEVLERLGEDAAEVHYDLRHQTVQDALLKMWEASQPVDLHTVGQHLKDRQLLDQVGGYPYLSQLQDEVPSVANLPAYLDVLVEKLTLRRMVQTCKFAVDRIYDFEGDAPELLDTVERNILRAAESRTRKVAVGVRASVVRGLEAVERMFQRQGAVSGLTTGFPDLDRMTDGLHGGEMIVIAGRPSTGKTSLGMNIAEHVAVELGLPVGVFSLEMSEDALVLRAMCSLGRVNLRGIQSGHMSEADFPKLMNASGRLSGAPLYIDDTAGLTVMEVRARARRMHQRHGIRLFVVDYLQLLHGVARRDGSREREVADISSGVKALAKELGVPVIVLAQLNRELDKDKKRKPRLSDLRESGAIENDADLVGILYKPDQEEDEQPEENAGVAVNLLIAKQRNGPTGDVNLVFLKPYTRFESAARRVAEENP